MILKSLRITSSSPGQSVKFEVGSIVGRALPSEAALGAAQLQPPPHATVIPLYVSHLNPTACSQSVPADPFTHSPDCQNTSQVTSS
jgi:hypothetical protein